MLGAVADLVASSVGSAVAAAEATIAANKHAREELKATKEAAKEAERERRLAEGLEEEEEEEEEGEEKPTPELDADGNPIPPPVIPVESLQTPEFMEVSGGGSVLCVSAVVIPRQRQTAFAQGEDRIWVANDSAVIAKNHVATDTAAR
jgi:hypothetical protein